MSEVTKKIVICGVGNTLHGDDGTGSVAAKELKSEIKNGNVMVLDCGNVPQNYIEMVLKSRPRKVIVICTTDMGKSPGSIEQMGAKSVKKLLSKNRKVKLEMFLGYLENALDEGVYCIVIQPRTTKLGRSMSTECVNAIPKIKEIVAGIIIG